MNDPETRYASRGVLSDVAFDASIPMKDRIPGQRLHISDSGPVDYTKSWRVQEL